MLDPVEAIVRSAVGNASHRAAPAEVASACLSALRRLHRIVEEADGPTVAAIVVDNAVAGAILAHNLAVLRESGRTPEPVQLPAYTSGGRTATAILEDAVDSSLLFHPVMPGDSVPATIARELVAAMSALLGGAPDLGELLDSIRGRSKSPVAGMVAAPPAQLIN
ncbi:hypothetical protein [Indioceanicola profundi]|uniref:hypothetical protein n=1 Tax=Indioceanicola profundi TaxID=2220096 RepID=UPI000E6ACD24|nr:hypothetical protein [Indioceanicola profundi]